VLDGAAFAEVVVKMRVAAAEGASVAADELVPGGLARAGKGAEAVVAIIVGGKETGDGVDGWHVARTTHAAISRQKRERIRNRSI